MLPPAAIVFDLDGTLIDSRGDIVAAVNHALGRVGHGPLSAQRIVRFVGDGARSLCARAVQRPEGSDEVDRMLDAYVSYYSEHPVDFTRWMAGAQQVLEELGERDEFALALCTNKPRATTDAVLAALGVRTRFRAVVAGGDIAEKKPAPGPLLHVASLLRMPVPSLVMVGDGPQDVEAARAAGCRSIGVDSGFFPQERLADARPDVIVRSLAELPDIIRRWRDATARISLTNG